MHASQLTQRPVRSFRCLDGGTQLRPAYAENDFDIVIEDLDGLATMGSAKLCSTSCSCSVAYVERLPESAVAA
jgi:hypothetical protein